MRYCSRCVYPENAKPTIIFDEHGVCSGCRVHESKEKINWSERETYLREILAEYKSKAAAAGNPYDCIIPVSGGKDSHYQVYQIKEVYGLNPLLVTYNHIYNTELGVRNLANLVRTFDCDLIRFTSRPDAVRRIDQYMLRRVGDITWHYHTGIFTFPFQVAVRYRIPLIIWGEHGYSEMTGMFRLEDIPEFTKWCRQEYEMRGVEIEDILHDPSSEVMRQDLVPFIFPPDEEIEAVGIRGIYLGNYVRWDHLDQIKLLTSKYGFKVASWKRDRTFSLFHKIDDHANDVHDYLKYLKFGYGRATDHSSEEIRCGRMTREEAIGLVAEYDHNRPHTLDLYLEYLGMTEDDFEQAIEHQRDLSIWQRDAQNRWFCKDSVVNHINDPGIDKVRLPLLEEEERTFGKNNYSFYYSANHIPFDNVDDRFIQSAGRDEFLII
jgi:N-acetyl sugar amidotransferase